MRFQQKPCLFLFFIVPQFHVKTAWNWRYCFQIILASKIKLADGFMIIRGIKLWNRQSRAGKKMKLTARGFHFHRKIKRNKISKVKLLNSDYYIVLFLKLKIAKCELFIVLESHLSILESWKLVIESWCYPEQIFCNPDGILITYFWNPRVIRSRFFFWISMESQQLFVTIFFCNPSGIPTYFL